jgi:hypothetical protein
VWQIIGKRIQKLGIELEHVGPHSLRHACATRLLQKGASLREITDFLGHRNIKSIGIYARYDVRSLRKGRRVQPGGCAMRLLDGVRPTWMENASAERTMQRAFRAFLHSADMPAMWN